MSTIRQVLEWGTQMLARARHEAVLLDAQVLLGHVLNVERATLYAYPERVLTVEQEREFRMLIERRACGEPVAYLTGHKEFYGLDFLVNRDVLIPRPETELLVETALDIIRTMPGLDTSRAPIVADIGTGCGAIAIALAVQEPRLSYVYASDLSREALDIARLNCQRHHVEQRVRLLHGDLLAPLAESVDIVIANLPYVGTAEMDTLALDIRAYEPHLALFSGPSGLDLLQRLLISLAACGGERKRKFLGTPQTPAEAQPLHSELLQSGRERGPLRRDAVVVLEIGYQQREPLTKLIHELWPQAVATFRKDFAGLDRLVQLRIPAACGRL